MAVISVCKIRQTSPTVAGIRDDHVVRYHYAVEKAKEYGCCAGTDLGCGVGYGAYILAEAGLYVLACDKDEPAIDYAREYYSHSRVYFGAVDLANVSCLPIEAYLSCFPTDAFLGSRMLVAFEIIEHSRKAFLVLSDLQRSHVVLVGSVPNEDIVPYIQGKANPEHYRHYRPREIVEELNKSGWRVISLGCQTGKRGSSSQIRFDTTKGRTLVFVAEPI